MASKHEYWATRAAEPLFTWHGDTGTHYAAKTAVSTSVTILSCEVYSGTDGNEYAKFVAREADLTIERADYLTYDGRKWRVMEAVIGEDGLFEIEALRAQEIS